MVLKTFNIYRLYSRKLLDSDLKLFELSVMIQAFAQSLIAVFIPVILWKTGFSIPAIIVFFILFCVFDIPLSILARNLVSKVGARMVLIYSIFAEVIYLILLYNIHNNFFEIFFLALAIAVFDAFYWVSHIYIFIQSAHNSEKLRSDVGLLNIARNIGELLAPGIGAFIFVAADPKTLIFVSTVIMLLSLIPLYQMRHLDFMLNRKILSFKEFFAQPLEKVNYFFEALGAIQVEASEVIWPFFIFFLLGSLKQVALVPIIISVAGLIVTYITGRLSVRENIYKVIAVGALFLFIFWVGRVVYTANTFVVYSTVFLIGLTAILVDIPIDISIFERGKKTDVLDSAAYRNAFRMFARLLLYVFLFVAVVFFKADFFRQTFYVVATAMLVLFFGSWIVSRRIKTLTRLETEPLEMEQ